MKKCIYCNKTSQERTFNRVEHVMPRMMGRFENNFVLEGCVCDHCNTDVFSPLERTFKEDTREGVSYQMLNLEEKLKINIKNQNTKTIFDWNLNNDFFNGIFPFIILEGHQPKVIPVSQIKIKKYCKNGYKVLILNKLVRMNRKSHDFKKLKKEMEGVESKDVSIYTSSRYDGDKKEYHEAIEMLHWLDIKYRESKSQFVLIDPKIQKEIHVDSKGKITRDVARVIAKVAFNYFAYCAKSGDNFDIVYHNNFDKIKRFILGDLSIPVEDILQISNEPILWEEKISHERFFNIHEITFLNKGNNIISNICFLGTMNYEITLGSKIDITQKKEFGSGHAFDIVTRNISSITQNIRKTHTSDKPAKPGMFNRIL